MVLMTAALALLIALALVLLICLIVSSLGEQPPDGHNISANGGMDASCGHEANHEMQGCRGLDWGTQQPQRNRVTAWAFLENCLTRQQFRAEFGKTVTLGRLVIGHPELNDLAVSDSIEVSRQHCRLIKKQNRIYIQNLSETKQTRLNGTPVREPMRVEVGDYIQIGDVELRVIAIKLRSTQKI